MHFRAIRTQFMPINKLIALIWLILKKKLYWLYKIFNTYSDFITFFNTFIYF